MKKHKKDSVIKTKDGYFKCICVDSDTAVFAPTNKKGTRTKYRNMFALESKYAEHEANFELI